MFGIVGKLFFLQQINFAKNADFTPFFAGADHLSKILFSKQLTSKPKDPTSRFEAHERRHILASQFWVGGFNFDLGW